MNSLTSNILLWLSLNVGVTAARFGSVKTPFVYISLFSCFTKFLVTFGFVVSSYIAQMCVMIVFKALTLELERASIIALYLAF